MIPVVGSAAGSNGANFKTSLQLLFGAPTSSGSLTGKLVFHPAGTSGTSSDPTVTYNVGAGQVVTYPDIVAAFARSGLGSIDLVTAAGVHCTGRHHAGLQRRRSTRYLGSDRGCHQRIE